MFSVRKFGGFKNVLRDRRVSVPSLRLPTLAHSKVHGIKWMKNKYFFILTNLNMLGTIIILLEMNIFCLSCIYRQYYILCYNNIIAQIAHCSC